MLSRTSLISVTAFLCLVAGAKGQQQPTKIAIISLQRALIGTKDGQKASAELDTKFTPKKKEFDTRQSELIQLQDQYSKGGNLMNEEKRQQVARDIEEKKRRLERDSQDAQEEMNSEQQRILQGLGQRLMVVIEKYARDNGYTIVLDDSNPNTPILYSSVGINITQDIISLYDKTTPSGAPGTEAPPKPTTPGSANFRPSTQ